MFINIVLLWSPVIHLFYFKVLLFGFNCAISWWTTTVRNYESIFRMMSKNQRSEDLSLSTCKFELIALYLIVLRYLNYFFTGRQWRIFAALSKSLCTRSYELTVQQESVCAKCCGRHHNVSCSVLPSIRHISRSNQLTRRRSSRA